MWRSNFLVEVTVNFGVLLAVPRNETRKKVQKTLQVVLYIHVLAMQKNY